MASHFIDVQQKDHAQLIEIWEQSVRATHDFLPEAEIERLKPLILNQYFNSVTLKGYRDTGGELMGFLGVKDNRIEMLFIAPEAQGKGIGSTLCQYAMKELKATQVDVNEQNPRARAFYEKMGFSVFKRSELDGEDRPYPILHMTKGFSQ